MEIVIDYPPNIEKIRAVFELKPGIIFTYGNRIYNPQAGYVNPPLMVHEEVHAKQQGDDPEAWWDRYLVDASWRATQEIAAYRKQFREVKKVERARERRHTWLVHLAKEMASPMYGNCMSFQNAMKAIKHEKLF